MDEYGMKNEKKFRKWFLVAAGVILGITVIISTVLLVNYQEKQNKYQSAMKNANHYYKIGDYQNAIVWYENAIEIDKKKENSYLNLSTTYIALGDYTSAEMVITQGMKEISSSKLKNKQSEIRQIAESAKQEEIIAFTEEEIKEFSSEAAIENNAVDMVAAYTYTDYFRDYGEVSSVVDGKKIILSYPQEGMKTVYYDLEKEKVVDSSRNKPYAKVKPVEVQFTNLRKLFATGNGVFVISYEKLQEIFGNSLTFHQDAASGMCYITAEYKKCRISVETDENGNIISETAWNKLEPLNRGAEEFAEDGVGEVKGYVQDAITGKGMKATLKVRSYGKKSGAVVKQLQSSSDGSYLYSGDAGKYTVEASAQGYITEYFDIEVVENQVKTGKNVVLSPEVQEGEIRIVLTWGSSPTDLDSYAVGKSSSGKNFNIYFGNPYVADVGNLDVDDTTSYGPETITITDTGSSFLYTVKDFRKEGTMGGSEATVKVYLPGESSAIVFKVPVGSGLEWDVFRYEKGEISTINTLK